MRACLAAPSPAAYAEAARLASDLLDLRSIEHGFVTALVEAEVCRALEERMAAVGEIVDEVFAGASLDGGEGGSEGSGDEGAAAMAAVRAVRGGWRRGRH